MSDRDRDNDGVKQVLVEKFVKHRLPQILALKDKVDAGNTLTESEIDQLARIIEAAKENERFVHVWPEYKPVIMQIINTYHEITRKALENESKP